MRKMKKFSDGGRAARGDARYERMMKDIESDYTKAKSRKTGRALEVAEAKYNQRKADAADDRAKARGEDRTATRAAEKAAERDLTLTRRYGSNKPKLEDKPLATPKGPSEAEMTKISTMAPKSQTFKEAFAAARARGDKTFKWDGKPGTTFTTQLASEKKAAPTPARRSPPASTNTPAPASKQVTKPQQTTNKGNAKPDMAAAFAKTPPKPAAKPEPSQSQKYLAAAAKAERDAAEARKLEQESGSAGNRARLKAIFGFGATSDTRLADTYRGMATRAAAQQAAQAKAAEERKQADAARAKRRAATIAKGERPGATGYERSTAKFYRENPTAMKKGGSVKGYAKGGSVRSVDGIAKRGKTRAPMKRK